MGLKFLTPGTQKFTVTDLDKTELTNEVSIKVTSVGFQGNNTSSVDINLVIVSPKSGSTKEQKLTVEGTGPSLTDIYIYDYERELGKMASDSKGEFKITTPSLPDGKHQLYAGIIDKDKKLLTTSNKVDITVDITPPTIDAVQFLPDIEVAPSQKFEIKLTSEPKLAKATAIVNDQSYTLQVTSSDTSVYSTKISAPDKAGNYSIDFVLLDQLGNIATFPKQTNIIVNDEKKAATEESSIAPSIVTGLEADPASSNRITLTWEASIDDKGINNYRIYYAVDCIEHSNKEDTAEDYKLDTIVNTFDSSTTWYIPNLKPKTNYCFAITAIDSDFNESKSKSDVVFATTLVSDNTTTASFDQTVTPATSTTTDDLSPSDLAPQPIGGQVEQPVEETPPPFQKSAKQPKSGAGTYVVIIMSLVFLEIYTKVRKAFKKKEEI